MPRPRSTFPGCRYGPLGLRPLLRERLQPGEQLLAMGAADTAGRGWRALTLLSPAMPIGGFWSARLLRRRRVLVLTDRRLLVLAPDTPGLDATGVRWNAEIALSQLTVCRVAPRTFSCDSPDGSFVARLRGRWLGAEPGFVRAR